ncbi:MAG TPA: hypothetical protein VF086_17185 [Propionibacteriaceae bacterium]
MSVHLVPFRFAQLRGVEPLASLARTIGRAALDGTDVDIDFACTGVGSVGVAVDKQYLYFAIRDSSSPLGPIGRPTIDGEVLGRGLAGLDGHAFGVAVGSR